MSAKRENVSEAREHERSAKTRAPVVQASLLVERTRTAVAGREWGGGGGPCRR